MKKKEEEILVVTYYVNGNGEVMKGVEREYTGNQILDIKMIVKNTCQEGIWDRNTFYPSHRIFSVEIGRRK